MASVNNEFMLDFTVHLQRQELPTYQKVASCYAQTIVAAPLNVMLRASKPCVFILQTYNDKDAKKIEGNFLTYHHVVKKVEKQIRVHFKKLPKYKFYSNPKWIKLDWVQESGLRFAKNTDFDTILEKFGDIIEPTSDDKNELGMWNGRKKARVDLNKGIDIERIKEIEIEVVFEEGVKRIAKGKIKFIYPGQPVYCKSCKSSHLGKCPEIIKEEEILKDFEAKRVQNTKSLIISDSQARCFNQQALNAQTHVASGAKIGHVGNVMEHTDMEKYKNIILNVGINNVNGQPDTVYEAWQKQLKVEVCHLSTQIKNCASAGKKVCIVEIPNCPATDMTQKTNKMRNDINSELKSMTERINKKLNSSNVKIIKTGSSDLSQEEAFSDNVHFSHIRASQLLEEMDLALKPEEDLIIRNRPNCVPLTTPRIYSKVNSSYKFGCGVCTRLGHSADTCQSLKNLVSPESNNKSGKRQASLGNSPDAKR